jgi:hypothetical protein
MIRIIFGLWVLAFALKHGGASWDVAWHFRFVFDPLEPPHFVNAAGTALALALLVFQIGTGLATERNGLTTTQIGMVIFLISGPLDLLNHWLFGLDITIWSPTHMLQYTGTTVTLIGVLQSWLKLAEPGRWRLGFALAFWMFLVDDVLYPLRQQEYGALVLDAYAKGQTTASPELLALAGRNPAAFVQGNIPDWIYPLWLILFSTLVLVAARTIDGRRWTATSVAGLYLAYRVIGDAVLGAASFPHTFIPFMLLGGALVVDLAARWRWQPLLTTTMLVCIYYGSATTIGWVTPMPPFALTTAPVVAVALWTGLNAAAWYNQKREQNRAAPVAE